MDDKRKIANNIRNLAGTDKANFETFVAKVVKVNETSCDVERVLDGKRINNVRLNASLIIDDGLVISPGINSYILVTKIDSTKYFASQFSKIDKISINLDGEMVINGGENGGIAKVEKIVENLDKIKTYLNSLNTAISEGLSGTAGNAGVAAAGTFMNTMDLQSLEFEDMKNDKIKH